MRPSANIPGKKGFPHLIFKGIGGTTIVFGIFCIVAGIAEIIYSIRIEPRCAAYEVTERNDEADRAWADRIKADEMRQNYQRQMIDDREKFLMDRGGPGPDPYPMRGRPPPMGFRRPPPPGPFSGRGFHPQRPRRLPPGPYHPVGTFTPPARTGPGFFQDRFLQPPAPGTELRGPRSGVYQERPSTFNPSAVSTTPLPAQNITPAKPVPSAYARSLPSRARGFASPWLPERDSDHFLFEFWFWDYDTCCGLFTRVAVISASIYACCGMVLVVTGSMGIAAARTKVNHRQSGLKTGFIVMNILGFFLFGPAVFALGAMIAIVGPYVSDQDEYYYGHVVTGTMVALIGAMTTIVSLLAACISCCCAPIDETVKTTPVTLAHYSGQQGEPAVAAGAEAAETDKMDLIPNEASAA